MTPLHPQKQRLVLLMGLREQEVSKLPRSAHWKGAVNAKGLERGFLSVGGSFGVSRPKGSGLL